MVESSTDNPPRLLVIIPAFNEAASIADVVRDVHRHAPEADIVVIDDGSTDGTAGHVPEPARVIVLPFNLGIGGAMQTGYRFARQHGYDRAAQIDGDGQHPADQLATIVNTLDENRADMVVGSRFLQANGYRQDPARMAAIRFLGSLLKLLTGKRFTDCTSGYRVVNRKLIESFARWYPDDYPEPEVLLLAHRAGFRIEETSVRMKQREAGTSSISSLQGVFYVIKVAVALVLDLIRDPWPRQETKS